MTNPLTKTEAALLYGYGYRLVDKYKKVWNIIVPLTGSRFVIQQAGANQRTIGWEQIGTDYHVLVHPLSRLTTEIEGIGVAIVGLAKKAFPGLKFYVASDFSCRSLPEDERTRFAYRKDLKSFAYNYHGLTIQTYTVPNQQSLFAQMYAWHFDCCNFIERGIGKEITV